MKKLNLILAAFVLALIGFTSCDEKIDTTVHVEGIEITAPADEAITMKVGETQTLTVVVTPDNAENKTFSTVSSDASVVSVDEANLVIKAEKEGTATITVTTLEEKYTFTDVINVTVVKDAEPATYDWYLVGTFNEWTVADAAYGMAKEGDWYVLKNFVAEEGNETKFNAGTWDVNRGGDFTAVNEAIAVAHNGNNIKVPAGTYDVYLCADEAVEYAFFMTPGEVPTHPQEPVVEEMTFEITAEYGDFEGVACWIGTVVPSDDTRYYIPGYISQAELDAGLEAGAIAEATVEAFAEYQSATIKMLAGEYGMDIAEAVAIILEEQGAQGTVQIPTDVVTGKNYFLAFTFDAKGDVEGLEYLMFHEEQGQTPPDEPEVYTASEALALILAGENNPEEYVTVTGTISEIQEVSTSYGNATYYISDDGTTTNQLMVFRGKYIDGEKFTAEDQIAVGDKVVIEGLLINYNDQTPEVTSSKIISIEGGETPGDLVFTLDIVETTTNDIKVAIDAPEGLPLDEYGEPMQYIVNWAPASEIGGLSDEELFQRELDVFAAEYEEYADMSWWSYASAVSSFTLYWGDIPSDNFTGSLQQISTQLNNTINDGVEYEVYVYAVEIDEEAKTCYLLTNIARERATTIAVEKVDMSFEFGWDRVTNDAYGLSAYVAVTPSNDEQLYTFSTVSKENLPYAVMSGATEMDDEVADEYLKLYVQNQFGGWFPTDPSEWTYTGYSCSGPYDALTINADPAFNIYYIVAAALDADYNICSEVSWIEVDITDLESTDAKINLVTTMLSEGSYTYSTSPEGVADEAGYILFTIPITEMEKYLDDNYYYDYEISTYVNDIVGNALAAEMEQGVSMSGAVESYLMWGEGAQYGAVNKNITVEEDTYVIAYTLYESSGTINGLETDTLFAPVPEATVVNLTEADGVEIAFNSETIGYQYVMNFSWNDGNIRFRNQDGEFSYETYEYTNTKHIILDQVYSTEDDTYNIYPDYTYLGVDEYDENGVKVKRATLVVTDNEDGTYTVTADVLWKNNTHYMYIYTGPIDSDLINGTPIPFSVKITTEQVDGFWTGTFTPSDDTKYYLPFNISDMILQSYYEGGQIEAPTIEAIAKVYAEQYKMMGEMYGMNGQEVLEAMEAAQGVQVLTAGELHIGKNYFFAFSLTDDFEVDGLTSVMFRNVIDTSVPVDFVAVSVDTRDYTYGDGEEYEITLDAADGSSVILDVLPDVAFQSVGTYSIESGNILSSWSYYYNESTVNFESLTVEITETGLTGSGILDDGRTINISYEGAIVFN